MGNQVANQRPQQQSEARQPQQQQQQNQKKERRRKRWLPNRKHAEASTGATGQQPPPSNNNHHNNSGNNNGNSTTNCQEDRPPQPQPQPLTLTTTTTTEVAADVAVAGAVAADATPSPDSANRTWSEADAPATEEAAAAAPAFVVADAADAAAGNQQRQRDSGISQLSTEEFERAFADLARGGPPQPQPPPQTSTSTELQLLTPRLRAKRSPTFVLQPSSTARATSAAADFEAQLTLRQELLGTTGTAGTQRRSAYSAVNDDHLFPDAVTPCKVDSGLLDDYDVPYMDDETFFVFDDWYITDDKRWSYLRQSDSPQLADLDDCRLTGSVPNSAKATPHATPSGLFGGRRTALLGLCFGAKSRA